MHGILSISGTTSSVNGIVLAVCGAPSPFDAATGLIRGMGFERDDPITVTGQMGMIGGMPVFCVTGAQRG
jgi:hypothetical protein